MAGKPSPTDDRQLGPIIAQKGRNVKRTASGGNSVDRWPTCRSRGSPLDPLRSRRQRRLRQPRPSRCHLQASKALQLGLRLHAAEHGRLKDRRRPVKPDALRRARERVVQTARQARRHRLHIQIPRPSSRSLDIGCSKGVGARNQTTSDSQNNRHEIPYWHPIHTLQVGYHAYDTHSQVEKECEPKLFPEGRGRRNHGTDRSRFKNCNCFPMGKPANGTS